MEGVQIDRYKELSLNFKSIKESSDENYNSKATTPATIAMIKRDDSKDNEEDSDQDCEEKYDLSYK